MEHVEVIECSTAEKFVRYGVELFDLLTTALRKRLVGKMFDSVCHGDRGVRLCVAVLRELAGSQADVAFLAAKILRTGLANGVMLAEEDGVVVKEVLSRCLEVFDTPYVRRQLQEA